MNRSGEVLPMNTRNLNDQKNTQNLVEDGELVAVIAAAIEAYTGSNGFKIRSIKENKRKSTVSNWVMSGRLEAFKSRIVTRRSI